MHTAPETVAHPSVDYESGLVTIDLLLGAVGYSAATPMARKSENGPLGLLDRLQHMLESQISEGQGWRKVLPKAGAGFPSGAMCGDQRATCSPVDGDCS